MKVLIACEYSGKVRDAFINAGHDAISCDLLEGEGQYHKDHYKGNVFDIINNTRNYESFKNIDLLIAFPPCTFLCSSGLHWNKRVDGRQEKTEKALEFVSALLNSNIPKIALENPIGGISTRIRKWDQTIQPHEFGHDASKKTCLWLKGLPKLIGTEYIEPSIINGKKIWANQTPSGQNKLGPSKDRWKLRSTTYQGIADAMAQQWGTIK